MATASETQRAPSLDLGVRLRSGNPAMIGTLVLVASGTMLVAAFAGAYLVLHRLQGHDFVPEAVRWSNYGGATAASTAILGSFAAQWAVTSTRMGHRRYTQMAWALTVTMGVALANLIWYLGVKMELAVSESAYAVVVYGLLAASLLLVVVGTIAAGVGVARTAADHSTADQPQLGVAAAWVWHLGALAWIVAYLLIYLYK